MISEIGPLRLRSFSSVLHHLSSTLESHLYTSSLSSRSERHLAHKLWPVLWGWIKETFLFCFFDEEDGTKASYTKALGKLFDVYYPDPPKKPTERRERRVRRLLSRLPSQLKCHIIDQMGAIIEEVYPKKSEKEIDRLRKKVLAHPFMTIEDKTQKKADREVSVLGHAIIQTADQMQLYIGS